MVSEGFCLNFLLSLSISINCSLFSLVCVMSETAVSSLYLSWGKILIESWGEKIKGFAKVSATLMGSKNVFLSKGVGLIMSPYTRISQRGQLDTEGDIWQCWDDCGCHNWGAGVSVYCYWHLVERGQGCCSMSQVKLILRHLPETNT